MLFKSELASQVSGKIGGVVYSHHTAGLVRRGPPKRAKSCKKRQREVQNGFSYLSNRWNNALNDDERQAWAEYAKGTPLPNVFGDFHHISGKAMFLRCNYIRYRAGVLIVQHGPTLPGLAAEEDTSYTFAIAGDSIILAFPPGANWRTEDGACMQVLMTHFLPNSRQHEPKRKREWAISLGSAAAPPPGLVQDVNPYNQEAAIFPPGFFLQAEIAISRADGRRAADVTLRAET